MIRGFLCASVNLQDGEVLSFRLMVARMSSRHFVCVGRNSLISDSRPCPSLRVGFAFFLLRASDGAPFAVCCPRLRHADHRGVVLQLVALCCYQRLGRDGQPLVEPWCESTPDLCDGRDCVAFRCFLATRGNRRGAAEALSKPRQ